MPDYICEKCGATTPEELMVVKNPDVDGDGQLIGKFVYICHSCAIGELNHRMMR